MIVGPDPPLDFDETTRVLRDVHVDDYVVVMMIESGRGNPSVTLRGWLHLDVQAAGAWLVVRRYPGEELDAARRLGNVLCIAQPEFRGAGEGIDADPPGPLEIELEDRRVIVDGINCAPDWSQLDGREGRGDEIGVAWLGGPVERIHVALQGEGVDVWRPVDAEVVSNRVYRLPHEAPPDETWRFPPGSLVRCAWRQLSDGPALVAVEELPERSS